MCQDLMWMCREGKADMALDLFMNARVEGEANYKEDKQDKQDDGQTLNVTLHMLLLSAYLHIALLQVGL